MKHLLFFLSLSFFAIHFVEAQLQVGPKAGLSIYQVTRGGNDNFRLGIYAGGFIEYEVNKKVNFQTDVAFIQKGSKEGERAVKLDYIQFSPTIKLFTRIENNRGFYILTGLGFNLLLKDEITFNNSSLANNLDVKSFDTTLQLGLGYKFDSNLTLDFRMLDGSLSSIASGIKNVRNIGGSITLAYGLNL